jgi:hypothetical protein
LVAGVGREAATVSAQERAERRSFLLGVMWAAWWLHSGHGEDSYAAWLLRESMPVDTARRMARKEQFQFKRGFWQQSELRRSPR